MTRILIALYGDSGAGKDTLMNSFLNSIEQLNRVIRYTSRSKRPQEVDGIDYHFIDDETASQLLDEKIILEKEMHNNWHFFTTLDSLSEGINIGTFSQEATASLVEASTYYDDFQVLPVLVHAPMKQRLIRAIDRNPRGIEETIRRFYFDMTIEKPYVEPVYSIESLDDFYDCSKQILEAKLYKIFASVISSFLKKMEEG